MDDLEVREIESVLNNHNAGMLKKVALKQRIRTSTQAFSEKSPQEELKLLLSYLKYVFLSESNTLPVILSISLTVAQVEAIVTVLKRRKRAMGWQILDIYHISLALCMHRIFIEEGHKLMAQPQWRLNTIMKEMVKKEVIKWLGVGIVFPISDNKWVSPVQCVPKKDGITIVTDDNNELIPTKIVIGWRICMDYRKLNDATSKDYYPVYFINQMPDKLTKQENYYFLDRYSGYSQITIVLEDQEKTTITCPYGTYAFRSIEMPQKMRKNMP